MKIFGTTFRELRLIGNKSQTNMANILNVTQSAISHWEAGRKIPEVPMLIAIAKYFDVTTDYLLGLNDY